MLILGVLQGLWRRLKWNWPEDETQACWWIANYGEEDKTKDVKMICRSMAVTRMELHQSRLATSAKLRAEWDRRLEKNAVAVDALNSNRQLWLTAGGPDPEGLTNPSEMSLEHCAKTIRVLQAMLQKHGPRGGLDSFLQDIESAVKMMRVVSWEAIRKDRFSFTPQALFDELARTTQFILSSWSGDATRRQARMKAPLEEEGEKDEEDVQGDEKPLRHKDKYGLDIDGEFRTKKSQNRFRHWEEVVKIANEVHLDEMRTLLERAS